MSGLYNCMSIPMHLALPLSDSIIQKQKYSFEKHIQGCQCSPGLSHNSVAVTFQKLYAVWPNNTESQHSLNSVIPS